MSAEPAYQARRKARALRFEIRGLQLHVWCWEAIATTGGVMPAAARSHEGAGATVHTGEAAARPRAPLVALHGWMDLGVSFQFLVDHLPDDLTVYAPDWRGFGHSSRTPGDSYWFYDYLGDLDRLLAQLVPGVGIDLLGHSMGGNVAMMYAGVRPERILHLINLEGAGLAPTDPADAPARLRLWLDELASPRSMRAFDSLQALAQRLMSNDPRLPPDRARWLAAQWSRETGSGSRALLADPQHKQTNPYLYRADEIDACWQAITAPVLWVDSEHPSPWHAFTASPQYKARRARIRHLRHCVLPGCGHMMHHDQPEALAGLVTEFIRSP